MTVDNETYYHYTLFSQLDKNPDLTRPKQLRTTLGSIT